MKFDLAHSIVILERTPRVLEALLLSLPDGWIAGNEGAETWSPFDIVGHLIDGEQTDWMVRLHIILKQGVDRRFEPYDRYRHLARNHGRVLGELLVEFRRLRERNLAELRGLNLTTSQLGLTGDHPAFGTVSLEQLLAAWVAHDLGHLSQVTRVMAKQYREAVGPWVEYLRVLDP